MNYPTKIKKNNNNLINYDNRGMSLESDINITNDFYISYDKAYIYKKPTPIKVTKVDYPSRKDAIIKEAFYTTPSTTDYNGIYKGYYIDFEAKETKCKTSFSLSNIHKHQINHLKNIYRHNGISFIIVRFSLLNETYLLMTKDLLNYIDKNIRKSIPLSYFKEYGHLIKDSYQPRIDYLKIIDKILED